MRKIKFRYVPLLLFALLIIFLIFCPIINDSTAKGVAEDIWSTPVPPGIVKVEKISKAGKLVGSGNGMQFFGAILIQSDFSLEEIRAVYADYAKNEWSYLVEEQTRQEIEAIEHQSLAFHSDIANGSFFIVYSWGDGLSPFYEFDLRGH